MRLKTLEIKGFKSFADQTLIHFDQDVIGIVGPNGSGKSNIVDAIRWVLGEQKSKELRLDQMTSVLFNGSKKRKPTGAAQVSLTFENTKNLIPTDFHTVTISRILYRSGESEYRLNNVVCRLKDITSLFLDTGIGSNSYAIIALGMVDDILADKENARRRMFEQAAGISKYKLRKRETLAKLESATEDLNRVQDLLFEIEGNLATLEKQAKRTQKYFELRELYKEASLVLAAVRARDLVDKQKAIQQQYTQAEDLLRQQDIDLRQAEARLEAEKKANLDKEKNLSERQRDLNQVVGQIRGWENDKKMLEQKAVFLQQTALRLQDQVVQARDKIAVLDGEILQYREQLQEEKILEVQLEQDLEAADRKLVNIRESHGALKADLESVAREQQSLEKTIVESEKHKALNLNQISTLRADQQRNQYELAARQEEMTTLETKVAELEGQEKQQLEALNRLREAEEKRLEKVKALEAQVEQTNRQLQQLNRQLDARRNEYKLTQSMVESLEGFPESIKFLTQSKQWKKEAPLLSDLIYVQEEYRVAIENFLEPYLSYYVIDNLEEATQAIRLLHDAQKGKANFFLLDAFADYQPPLVSGTDLQPAFDLVETELPYRHLLQYLLENVFVTDKEEIRQGLPDERMVLLARSGRFIQRKYSLSGGSIGLFEGKKIGRKKNLEILETAIHQSEREEQKLSTAFYQLKDQLEALRRADHQGEIQRQTLALNQTGQEKAGYGARLENFHAFAEEKNRQHQNLEERIARLLGENEEMDQNLATAHARLKEIMDKIALADDSFRKQAEMLSQASLDFNQKNIEFIRQQNKVSTYQREVAYRERQLEELRAQSSQNEQQLAQLRQEEAEQQEQAVRLETDLVSAYRQRSEREAFLTEAEQSYFKARGAINDLETALREANRKKQDSQLIINQLKDKLTELRFQLSTLGERINIEFQADINELLKKPAPETPDLAEEQAKLERLKNRLDNYGEINPLAVEAYHEMKERYDAITVQRDDILKAKEDLLETIREIEETATAQFLFAFDKARNHFIDVFRSLFTADDTCDLVLLDPNDPLESNIDIIAKPKGKKPQTISQLSGGEKTLTAIALLFALYLLKPAPFCIFDEVDAPLDDANIEKFNRIIKRFSTDSQFIIVTHNKSTMAAVDTIYGVYMQEMGVSNVSAVDFRALN